MITHKQHIMTANQFKAVRNSLKLSQTEMAKALGCSIRQIAYFETGEKSIDRRTAFTMAWISKFGIDYPWCGYGINK